MMRSKSLWFFLSAATVAAALTAVACGDDDNGNGSTPTTDSGTGDSSPNNGGDAGCTFAGFVINLVNTQTTATATPSTDLGDSCTPATSQDEFKSLFP